jgi:hypothetical protein
MRLLQLGRLEVMLFTRQRRFGTWVFCDDNGVPVIRETAIGPLFIYWEHGPR